MEQNNEVHCKAYSISGFFLPDFKCNIDDAYRHEGTFDNQNHKIDLILK